MTAGKPASPEQVRHRLAHRMTLLENVEEQYDAIDTITEPRELSEWLQGHLLTLLDLNDDRDDPDYRGITITTVTVWDMALRHLDNASHATCRIRIDMTGINDPLPLWHAMNIIGITPVQLSWCAPGSDFTIAICRLDATRWSCLTVMLVLSSPGGCNDPAH